MRRVVPLFGLFAILAAAAVAGWRSPAAAQDATPAAEAEEFPITPDLADCRIEPRSIDDLVAPLVRRRRPRLATPPAEATATEVTIPVGSPADEATVAGVVATIREVIACQEAGDLRRTTALVTDDLARSRVRSAPGSTEEEVRRFLAQAPEPANRGRGEPRSWRSPT